MLRIVLPVGVERTEEGLKPDSYKRSCCAVASALSSLKALDPADLRPAGVKPETFSRA